MLTNPRLRPIFDRNYVVLDVDVMEDPDKVSLETPGGIELSRDFGVKNMSLPYFIVLRPDGKNSWIRSRLQGGTLATRVRRGKSNTS
jgi:hypothetical protein